MYIVLRVIRAIFGVLFASQVLQVFEAISLIVEPGSADVGKIYAIILVKTVVMLLSLAAFFGLRNLINWVHIKRKGAPHPALATKKWSL